MELISSWIPLPAPTNLKPATALHMTFPSGSTAILVHGPTWNSTLPIPPMLDKSFQREAAHTTAPSWRWSSGTRRVLVGSQTPMLRTR